MDLTHFDQSGNAWMVDVGHKDITERTAIAEGFISVTDAVYDRVVAGTMKKGDVLSVAQIASIMGAKQTSTLIPLCHPLALTKVEVQCEVVLPDHTASCGVTITESHNRAIKVRAIAKTIGKTGVEMEALTAVQVGLLTIYDMCKAMDKGMIMGPTYLVEKEGGKSGHFVREA